jgi:hypothetical protein
MERAPLSKVLIQLRKDLLDAQKEGEGRDLRFVVRDVEVELQVVATAEAEVGGGVRVWVLSAEGGGKAGETVTQTLRLKLGPVDKDDHPAKIASDETLP